ncbi:hypothetical protein ADUPG1_007409 [Aduncisulcus paluster]|uniref:Chromo domain-containing protein n=1 Tax=Aduncisulcus paluster TaxID=2918883 RepID=A0ABQ5KM05_9EUKA|nr:hypothetical protein ADUPG1_007409 [Aduncisulcus paluster]
MDQQNYPVEEILDHYEVDAIEPVDKYQFDVKWLGFKEITREPHTYIVRTPQFREYVRNRPILRELYKELMKTTKFVSALRREPNSTLERFEEPSSTRATRTIATRGSRTGRSRASRKRRDEEEDVYVPTARDTPLQNEAPTNRRRSQRLRAQDQSSQSVPSLQSVPIPARTSQSSSRLSGQTGSQLTSASSTLALTDEPIIPVRSTASRVSANQANHNHSEPASTQATESRPSTRLSWR